MVIKSDENAGNAVFNYEQLYIFVALNYNEMNDVSLPSIRTSFCDGK